MLLLLLLIGFRLVFEPEGVVWFCRPLLPCCWSLSVLEVLVVCLLALDFLILLLTLCGRGVSSRALVSSIASSGVNGLVAQSGILAGWVAGKSFDVFLLVLDICIERIERAV